MAGFTVRDVRHVYAGDRGAVLALDDVHLTVAEGELVAVVGPSGCGKSTLLRLVAGLLQPTEGTVAFATPPQPGRTRCAFVFQEHALLPWLSVLENVTLGLELRGVSTADRNERARPLVSRMGLAAFADRYPHELSVGMRQRVGLARALLVEPECLLLDEPFASLDAPTRRVLQGELLDVWRTRVPTMLLVTHDVDEALFLADRVVVMSGRPGRVREDVHVPLARPRTPETRDGPEAAELRRRIWKRIEDDVRPELGLA